MQDSLSAPIWSRCSPLTGDSNLWAPSNSRDANFRFTHTITGLHIQLDQLEDEATPYFTPCHRHLSWKRQNDRIISLKEKKNARESRGGYDQGHRALWTPAKFHASQVLRLWLECSPLLLLMLLLQLPFEQNSAPVSPPLLLSMLLFRQAIPIR